MTEEGNQQRDLYPASPGGGRAPERARGTYVVVGLALAVAIAGVVTFALYRSPRAITVEVTGYSVHPTDIEMTFAITKAYDAQATCALQALDRDGVVAGQVTGYVIGPQADHHRRTLHTLTIPTTTRAVTAQVESCVITRDH